jgi:hypothetical protein
VGVCGVSLNALLLFLILTKTEQAMRVYSRLLLMSGLIDLIVSFWTFLVQPVRKSVEDNKIYIKIYT